MRARRSRRLEARARSERLRLRHRLGPLEFADPDSHRRRDPRSHAGRSRRQARLDVARSDHAHAEGHAQQGHISIDEGFEISIQARFTVTVAGQTYSWTGNVPYLPNVNFLASGVADVRSVGVDGRRSEAHDRDGEDGDAENRAGRSHEPHHLDPRDFRGIRARRSGRVFRLVRHAPHRLRRAERRLADPERRSHARGHAPSLLGVAVVRHERRSFTARSRARSRSTSFPRSTSRSSATTSRCRSRIFRSRSPRRRPSRGISIPSPIHVPLPEISIPKANIDVGNIPVNVGTDNTCRSQISARSSRSAPSTRSRRWRRSTRRTSPSRRSSRRG